MDEKAWISILIILSVFICCDHDSGELDSVFKKLEELSPKGDIQTFEKEEFDSVIINHSKYDVIFADALNEVVKDSVELRKLEECYESYGLILFGYEAKWAFMAGFHHYLNGRRYDIGKLIDYMIVLKNEIDEKKYGRMDEESQ